tara:strand:+ start:147 stop:1184 length:1038 start_codon:yes stop_codon:yes gene_type:complete
LKKIILLNLLVFIFLYLILEILTGTLIFKNKLDCHYLSCDRTYIYQNDLTENEKVIFNRDKYGFRGLRKNVDKIDLLVVGGSTTEQHFLNLNDTWPELIEKKFRENSQNIDIVNAGIGGQSTVGHIWNFDNWFGKIKNFKTKYIIFYLGINDIKENIYENIATYDHGKIKAKNTIDRLIIFLKVNNGVTYKLVKFFYNKLYLKNVEIIKYEVKNKNDYKEVKKKFNLTKKHKKYLMNNLKEILRLTNDIKAIPIFITQKSFRGNIVDFNLVSVDEFDYYHAEKEVAETIINFCRNNDIFCIDLFNKIEFEYNDFYDLIHTTKKGAKKIAEVIFSELNNNKIQILN